MRLSTSVGLFFKDPAGRAIPSVESVRRCCAAGFRVLDMNFFPMLAGKTEFVNDDWERAAYAVRNEAERLGAVFSQAHLPYHVDYMKRNPPDDPDYNQRFDEWTRRSIIVCSILGVKWAVGHPYAHMEEHAYDTEEDLKLNLALYAPVFESLKRYDIGLAIENIVGIKKPMKKRYTAVVEELCALVDAFHDQSVGVCWDFGHGNRMYRDQRRPLQIIGKRLHATHLNDNQGTFDSHTLPFVGGNVDWCGCLPVLSEIGYQGDLTYELKFGDGLPDALKNVYARLAFEIGSRCIEIAEGVKL